MKKLILLFLLFYSFAYSQVDTANYNFLQNLSDGKFYQLISKNTVNGASGQRLQTQILQASSIDTTQFQFVPELSFGYYSMIENISSYYGMDSGKVRMMLFNAPTSSSSFDSSLFVKRSAFSQSIEATGGDFNITTEGALTIVSNNNMSIQNNGVDANLAITAPDGTIELGGQTITVNALNSSESGNILFTGQFLLTGGVIPATFDNYWVVKINNVSYKIPLILLEP